MYINVNRIAIEIANLTFIGGLKCLLGNSQSGTTTGACASGMDRCAKATKDVGTVWLCMSASIAIATGYKDEDCSTVGDTELCLCKGDGCNSAPTQSASQAITFFVVASMLKFALN